MTVKRMNTLDGKTWITYSISIWNITKSSEETKIKHPAMFPIELCNRLIEIYTMPGEKVLDPFLGSGSTLVSAKGLAREGIGLEINQEYVELSKRRIKQTRWGKTLTLKKLKQTKILEKETDADKISGPSIEIPPLVEPQIYKKSCFELEQILEENSIDFVLTSPPYWDIHKQKRTADYKEARPYSEDAEDLGNIQSYVEFINSLGEVFKKVKRVLKPKKYCAIVVMDIRKKDKFYPLHSDLANELTKRGFKFEDMIIWNRAMEYNNLRALGYPTVFRVNKVHEYILLFSKLEEP